MNARRRLEALEARARQSPAGPSDARPLMVGHLDRIADLRRDGATVENSAELAALCAAVERRLGEGRGEVGR